MQRISGQWGLMQWSEGRWGFNLADQYGADTNCRTRRALGLRRGDRTLVSWKKTCVSCATQKPSRFRWKQDGFHSWRCIHGSASHILRNKWVGSFSIESHFSGVSLPRRSIGGGGGGGAGGAGGDGGGGSVEVNLRRQPLSSITSYSPSSVGIVVHAKLSSSGLPCIGWGVKPDQVWLMPRSGPAQEHTHS
mgnify:CR=1 FL=1|jgi:hypothetical protein